MTQQIELLKGVAVFAEIEEFAGFSIESQAYIRRSLGVARGDSGAIEQGAESQAEADAVRRQASLYRWLDPIRAALAQPSDSARDSRFLSLLVGLSAFDLDSGELDGFASYRFLYERLLGSRVRPWLPSAFSAAALLPQVKPVRRLGLLRSLGDAAGASWSPREPSFRPEKVLG